MKMINQQQKLKAGFSNPNSGYLITEWWVHQPFAKGRCLIAADNTSWWHTRHTTQGHLNTLVVDDFVRLYGLPT